MAEGLSESPDLFLSEGKLAQTERSPQHPSLFQGYGPPDTVVVV